MKRWTGMLTVVALLGLASCGGGDGGLFPNLIVQSSTAPTPLPDGATPGSQYPSEITITTPHTNIQSLTILLVVTHEKAQDLDVLLVGPDNTHVWLMSDCLGDFGLTDQLFSFSDTSTTPVPTTTMAPPGVTHQPTDHDPGGDSDAMSSPAPTEPHLLNLGAFVGKNPNGTWKLFIEDDTGNGTAAGQLNGWQIWMNAD
jgi:subtilisin-like proprotein convertase family protein